MGTQPLDDTDGQAPSPPTSHEHVAQELPSETTVLSEQEPGETTAEDVDELATVEFIADDLLWEEAFAEELNAQEPSSEEPETSESSADEADQEAAGAEDLGAVDAPSMQDCSAVEPMLEDAEAEAMVEIVEQAITDVPVAAQADAVSETEFEHVVDDALEAVGGVVLFKMRIDEDGENKHVAAASIGDGERRQFLLLTLPAAGGKLKVESASNSEKPLAKLAKAYVGVVEAFRSAA